MGFDGLIDLSFSKRNLPIDFDIRGPNCPEGVTAIGNITVNQLQNRDLKNVDWEHLIEEITALGNEQKQKVESYLRGCLKSLSWCIKYFYPSLTLLTRLSITHNFLNIHESDRFMRVLEKID